MTRLPSRPDQVSYTQSDAEQLCREQAKWEAIRLLRECGCESSDVDIEQKKEQT